MTYQDFYYVQNCNPVHSPQLVSCLTVRMYFKFIFVESLKYNESEKYLIVMCTSGKPWYYISIFMESLSSVIVAFLSERHMAIFKHLQFNFTKQTDWLWAWKQRLRINIYIETSVRNKYRHLLRTEVSIYIDWYTRNRKHNPIITKKKKAENFLFALKSRPASYPLDTEEFSYRQRRKLIVWLASLLSLQPRPLCFDLPFHSFIPYINLRARVLIRRHFLKRW
jgi:hypothetical protein